MKILLISDSHYRSIEPILNYEYDAIFHAGDMDADTKLLLDNHQAYYVAGNCDSFNSNDVLITFNQRKILLTHSHRYQTKRGYERLVEEAKRLEAEIVIFGHTHHRDFFSRDGITFINPGDFLSGNFAVADEKSLSFMNYGGFINKKISLVKKIDIALF